MGNKMSYLDKILLFLYNYVGSGGVKFHSGGVNVGIHRGISLEQGKLNRADGGEVMVEAGGDAASHMLQQLGRDIHLLSQGRKDISIAHRVVHVVALHGLAEVGGETEINHKVVAHQLFLWGHAMIGVKVEVLQ